MQNQQTSDQSRIPCSCKTDCETPCSAKSPHHCICLQVAELLSFRPWSRQLRDSVASSVCRAPKSSHTCTCSEFSWPSSQISMSRACLAQSEHNCRCRIDPMSCKRVFGQTHECSCRHDPLACRYLAVDVGDKIPPRHDCVCRMQWYDGWQRVCRTTPESTHDCVCRYSGLTCRAAGSDIVHDDKPGGIYGSTAESSPIRAE